MPSLELIQGLVQLGSVGLLIVGFWLVLTGKLRVGYLVDLMIAKIEETFAKREAERDKRETQLVAEVAEWKKRYEEEHALVPQMAKRLELAYGILTGTVKAPGKADEDQ